MTQGRFILILDSNGDCLVSPTFNGDMQPVKSRGSEAIALLERCKNEQDFEKVTRRFIKKFELDVNYSDEELEEGDFLRLDNVIKSDFTYNMKTAGREYLERWFSDFLYVLNLCGSDVETNVRGDDETDQSWNFRNNSLTVLKFGRLFMTIPCVTDTLDDYEERVLEDVCEMSNAEACKILSEFNDWRRGIGIYGFNEDPTRNVDCPYNPKEIGRAIDVAVNVLKGGCYGNKNI